MPLDAVFLSGLTNELSAQITGARIDKIQQPERDLLLFGLRMQGGNGKLLLHGGVGSARVHLTAGSFENPSSPPMFCMLLRKHLSGARIRQVFQPPMERLLMLTLDCRDEMGSETEKTLIVEMMGRQSNVVLTDQDGIILDCMRRVDTSMSEIRPLLPGMRYRMPPVQTRPSLLDLEQSTLENILQEANPDTDVVSFLLKSFSGLSPLICREICFRAFGTADEHFAADSSIQKEKLYTVLKQFSDLISSGDLHPVLLMENHQLKDFSFTEITQYQSAFVCEEQASFSVLLDEFYLRRDQLQAMRRRSQTLMRTVKNQRDRVARKLALQREDLLRSENRDQIRRHAELITANIYRIHKGDHVLRTEDYFEPNQPTVEIPLDPFKTPQQNAALLFKRYQKAKNAELHLKSLIETGDTELQYLDSVLDELTRAEGEQDLTAIRSELLETGYLRPEKTSKKQKSKPNAPYCYISDSGYEILVGRSNAQNDALTLHYARRTDIWLHVQKIHGSHVIIRANDSQPDDLTISQAASLAVYYSQARDSGKTAVDYTMVRNVRKPAGALPGMVIYSSYQTVLAEADETLVSRLRSNAK